MSFLKEIAKGQPQLRRTETAVTSMAGQRVVYGADGKVKSSAGSHGFVVDTSPDDKLAKVVSGLYVGSSGGAQNLDGLVAAGVTHILNLAPAVVPSSWPDRFKYMEQPTFLDLPTVDFAGMLPEMLSFIDEAVDAGASCFVHCNMGMSRSVSVCCAWLMSRQRMSFLKALAAVKAVRGIANPNPGFREQLKRYEVSLGLTERADQRGDDDNAHDGKANDNGSPSRRRRRSSSRGRSTEAKS